MPATFGDGLVAPRELRSSATLFRLTERLIATGGEIPLLGDRHVPFDMERERRLALAHVVERGAVVAGRDRNERISDRGHVHGIAVECIDLEMIDVGSGHALWQRDRDALPVELAAARVERRDLRRADLLAAPGHDTQREPAADVLR